MYVSIVDYGTGNLNSVSKALEVAAEQISKKINIKISNKPKDILDSDKIILPGQGSYRQCALGVKNINGLWDSLNEFVLVKKKPIFGICVGMQLFSEQGYEEQVTEGFGWIKGSVKKIEINNKDLKLPHMGWNEVNVLKKNDLFLDIKNLSHFYFVHSFAFKAKDEEDVICITDYEKPVVAGILKENIFGTQFHPEKSQSNGIKLLSNFLNWNLL
ncbi:imidazole glycerol phosphate synthase subunit HisH [Candidatus Fonsibacter ubiquis]|uniref:imidazole glycerol phosphate synthase subunit HisH n=1 Tax=Candidatus Fonsibacter ubiquis TaxID=1925548 RepID=UPI000C0745CF|nr:imidazole glycerol phosphate synthase subunit HisH [Candidatus Fonsibacter ubiquis]